MKLFIEKVPDLQALYVKQLRMLLSAAEMIAIKTPFLVESSSDAGLREALRRQEQESELHATRLREILHRANCEPGPIKCKVVYALFDEAEDMVQDTSHEGVRDALLIAEAQRIRHYQIAFYGAVREFARVLDRAVDAKMLDESIDEARRADREFTAIAERVNPVARNAA
jgi:ferritin-like metal-binding protein YciE